MIYLDHAAATPVSSKVLKAMEPYFTDQFFNPSAAYLPAKKVAAEYEAAKGEIAHAIGAKATDLVITLARPKQITWLFLQLAMAKFYISKLSMTRCAKLLSNMAESQFAFCQMA